MRRFLAVVFAGMVIASFGLVSCGGKTTATATGSGKTKDCRKMDEICKKAQMIDDKLQAATSDDEKKKLEAALKPVQKECGKYMEKCTNSKGANNDRF